MLNIYQNIWSRKASILMRRKLCWQLKRKWTYLMRFIDVYNKISNKSLIRTNILFILSYLIYCNLEFNYLQIDKIMKKYKSFNRLFFLFTRL